MLASTAHDRDSEAWHEDLSDLQARVQFYEELHGADPTDEGWTADMAREASVLRQRVGRGAAGRTSKLGSVADDQAAAEPLMRASMPAKSTSKLSAWMQQTTSRT